MYPVPAVTAIEPMPCPMLLKFSGVPPGKAIFAMKEPTAVPVAIVNLMLLPSEPV